MFEDREEAAAKLCLKLKNVVEGKNIVVVALVRGGVVLGKVIADYFKAPLDIIVVKKIGAPQNSELAIGAIGPGNTVYWNNDLCKALGLSKKEKLKLKNEKEEERKTQEKLLGRQRIDIKKKSVILVDDGVATGTTVIAARKFFKKTGAKEVILTVPVISKDTLINIKRYFDSVCILKSVSNFYAVGQFFRNFPQVENEQVIEMLTTSH
ncbi:MAG: phosphoribosyltransferase [Patescibacteria group bacterium]|nr:phosphoribosyltransferase [Patescibacteria group bacterium]